MKKLIFILLALGAYELSAAQGCVAVRGNGASCMLTGMHDRNEKMEESSWAVSSNTRYFKSYRHFVGKVEQKHRIEEGTEVVNQALSTDFAVTKSWNKRASMTLYVPLLSNIRSSMYEHYGNTSKSENARRNTRSFGLGDIRVAGYYWMIDPAKNTRANIQLGVGLKLATGDYKYSDYYYKNDSTKLFGPVDQSIQLGDGGTGFTTEFNAFFQLAKAWSIYSNGFYLFNPREQNGVSTARGSTSSSSAIAYGSDVMSVPDQFSVRAGAQFTVKRFLLSAGVRIEGLPAIDLIGGSNGFRRPGYIVSAEPVVAYKLKKAQFYLSVPYGIERNRTQSVPDKIRTQRTGVYAQGDAAFADYSVNAGLSFQLHK